MEAFSANLFREFEREMLKLLRSRWPDQAELAPAEDLRRYVQAGMEKAAEFGITNEGDIKRFLVWMFPKGLALERVPELAWTRRILQDEELLATEKLNELENYEAVFARSAP